MATIKQLSEADIVENGDQFPFFSEAQGDTRKVTFATLKDSVATDFVSAADLAAQTGATLVGCNGGTTVQQELDAKVSATLDTDGTLAANSDARVASQKATKAYADAKSTALAASSGSSLVGFIQSGTGAVGRTVQDKLRETISVKDFGAVGDGVTNDAGAFSLAFAAAAGKVLTIPAGTYRLDSTPTAPNGSITIIGEDGATLLITHGGTRALHFTPAAANNTVSITGLTLQAGFASGPCPLGIDIEYPSVASFPYQQVHLVVSFRGDLNSTSAPWANTWARGVRLKNVWYPFIELNGSSYPDLGNTGATGAVEIVGGSYGCIGGRFLIHWYYGAHGILASAYMEGCTLLDGSELVNVTRGWSVPASTPLGGAAGVDRSYRLTIDNAHIAALTAAVDMDTVRGFQAMGVDVQRSASGAATNWTGYLLNQCQRPQIVGGLIGGNEASGGITTVGINATGANSAHGIVTGVSFENLDTQFILAAATSRWNITGNRSTGATPDTYTIGGAGHKVNWLKSNGEVIIASDQLNGPLATGVYTPTLIGVTNVDAATASACNYYRYGNMVTVAGLLALDPTAASALTELRISLPIASNFVVSTNCLGTVGTITQGLGGSILADTTNDQALLQILTNTTANHGVTFVFTYQVL